MSLEVEGLDVVFYLNHLSLSEVAWCRYELMIGKWMEID
jgi:hypothetical protein